MIEAMAAGLPVVVSSVGNIPDTVDHGVNGLLVPPKDAGAVQAALARVIDDAGLRRSLGSAAHLVAAQRFAVEPAVDVLVAAIHETLGRLNRRGLHSVSARN